VARTGAEFVLPSQAAGEVHLWNGNTGAIFGYEANGRSWIHVEGTATFGFEPGGSRVDALPVAATSASALRDVYERSVLPLVLQAAGRQVLHASAVYDGEAVTALAGVSRSGKSTIAVALAQRSFSLWADDAVAFVAARDAVETIPLPFAPRLRPSAAAELEKPALTSRARGPARLNAIVLLAQSPSAYAARLERVRGVDAFPALLPHAYCFSVRDRVQNRKLTEDYLDLAERVPVWRLRYRPDLERLPDVVDVLEAFMRG
jgi:hypothetical protein